MAKNGTISAKNGCSKKESRLTKTNLGSIVGAQGPKGDTGPQGATGDAGPQGVQGMTGSFTPKKFYITKSPVQGSSAATSCASGFHMASIWELWNPSMLTYDISLGETSSDSGQGPPNSYSGWVRTGGFSSGIDPAGTANCSAYTTSSGASKGTIVNFRSNWTTSNTVGPWEASSVACNAAARVWCIEN